MQSKSSHLATSFILLLVLGIGVLGAVIFYERTVIERFSKTHDDDIAALKEQAVKSTPANSKVIATGNGLIVTKVNGLGPTYTQYCDGTVMLGDDNKTHYCIGKNTLIFSNGIATSTIATDIATDAASAPELADIVWPPYSPAGKSNALISYQTSSCNISTDFCGAGMAENSYNFVLNEKDGTVRKIVNFPGTGKAVWSIDGVHALFIPSTCGGAGCGTSEIIGYNIETDAAAAVTKEKAVGEREFIMAGENGDTWTSVYWITDKKFGATIVKKDGTQKAIYGSL